MLRVICLSPILSETDSGYLELVRVRAGSESFGVKSLRTGSLEVPMSLGEGLWRPEPRCWESGKVERCAIA